MPEKHYLQRELEDLIRTNIDAWTFVRESSLDGIWYMDLINSENEWMSPEFWQHLGYDPSDKQHLTSEWHDLIFPEDLDTAIENLKKHCEDPTHPYDQVVRYRHRDGSTVWVRCRGLAIRDETGRPIRMLGAHHDMTALKRTEEELRQANARLRIEVDTATNGIISISPGREIMSANPAARAFLGLEGDLPQPWPARAKFLKADTLKPLEAATDPISRALSGKMLKGEIDIMTPGPGEPDRYVRISSVPVQETGSQIASVVVIEDVTEQELARQRIERSSRLDALGQLTSGIAHDFNNLLATMRYSMELAQASSSQELARTYLKSALDSVERGAEMTRRLLTFSRNLPGRPRSNRVLDVLVGLRDMARPAIEDFIDIRIDCPDEDIWVHCDRGQLEGSLLNLLVNSRDAIKSSGTGDTITLSAREIQSASGPDGEPAIEISVTDDGPGMTEDIRRRAADPFFTTKKSTSGSGLGLSMVYGFVQQSQGNMNVLSEPGRGTRVVLQLPLGTAAPKPVVREEGLTKNGSGERIFLVEDETDLRTIMEVTIEMLGYEVVSAETGRQALDMAESGLEFDLLLTDVVMPGGIGGFELAKRLRAARPSLPVIYMSGYTGFADEEMGNAGGPMLQKPSPPAELAAQIQAVLGPLG